MSIGAEVDARVNAAVSAGLAGVAKGDPGPLVPWVSWPCWMMESTVRGGFPAWPAAQASSSIQRGVVGADRTLPQVASGSGAKINPARRIPEREHQQFPDCRHCPMVRSATTHTATDARIYGNHRW